METTPGGGRASFREEGWSGPRWTREEMSGAGIEPDGKDGTRTGRCGRVGGGRPQVRLAPRRERPRGIGRDHAVGGLAAGSGDAREVRGPTRGDDPRVLAAASLDEAGPRCRGGGGRGLGDVLAVHRDAPSSSAEWRSLMSKTMDRDGRG